MTGLPPAPPARPTARSGAVLAWLLRRRSTVLPAGGTYPDARATAGAGPNGALPHYKPVGATIRKVEKGSLLLVDGGGQYLDGTTDVTRTMAVGEPSEDQRQKFTLVLKAHIAMATIRFPAGTSGMALDAIARRHGFGPWRSRFKGEIAEGHIAGQRITLLKPQTYMNASGQSVQPAAALVDRLAEEYAAARRELCAA